MYHMEKRYRYKIFIIITFCANDLPKLLIDLDGLCHAVEI